MFFLCRSEFFFRTTRELEFLTTLVIHCRTVHLYTGRITWENGINISRNEPGVPLNKSYISNNCNNAIIYDLSEYRDICTLKASRAVVIR